MNQQKAKTSYKYDVYHQYSVPTILQVVTPISFLEKISFVSF